MNLNSPQLKVAKITTLLDFGGQEQQYISFTDDPSLLKHKYIFAAIGHGGHAENIIRERGFQVRIFNLNPSIKNFYNILVLYKWLKKEKPDIVHTAAAEGNFHGVIAAKLAGIKQIYAEEIGLPNHSKYARIIFKYIYRLTDGVICVSKAVKQYLIEIGEIEELKGIVLYNPVSQPKYHKKILQDKFHLIYVGRLERVKNVSFLIKAIANLSNKEHLHLSIVGDGKEKGSIESLIKQYQLEDKIELVGFSKEPERYVSQADLFVLPSFSEGFGIAVVEAMFQGVPCLCSKVGGIPEFINNEMNGWLFDPNNLNELVTKLESIIKIPKNQLNQIGLNGKNYVLKNFTTLKYINDLERIFAK